MVSAAGLKRQGAPPENCHCEAHGNEAIHRGWNIPWVESGLLRLCLAMTTLSSARRHGVRILHPHPAPAAIPPRGGVA